MKTTFMFPLLGLFVEKQMRRFRITVRLYKSELSAGSRSYGAIKKMGRTIRLSYYARLVALLYDLAGEEEFRRLAHEAVELYIREREKGEKA